ncbi:lactoylglutathione lyase GLX1-like [Cornus florida]|uniref:lactoylglutathione lyase GLX1-like n=1 Tax=Cornus florida TaxID=4283 RepID=UPI0028A1481D|nr:lactoylglutathione lyase GLX1-like [Cornus florida]
MITYKQLVFCLLVFVSTIGPAYVHGDDSLEWVQKDNRRFLHVVYRVGDLNRTIKFYTECFGMQLLRKRENPQKKYSKATLGFGPEETYFVVKLIQKHGVNKIDIGTGFGHLGIATQNIYEMVELIRSKGGVITTEPGTLEGGGTTIFAFVQDPDGYSFELVQSGPTPDPLSQMMLRVIDLDRATNFYEKALGMKLLHKFDNPQEKYTVSIMGYGELFQSTYLELQYNYGVTEYTKGNGYIQVAISTDDVYKSAEAVKLVTKELGGNLILPPGPIPGIKTKVTSFVDPDGWKAVLVDNEDFLKGLQKKE